MKKICLSLFCAFLSTCALSSCRNAEVTAAKETPALLFAQRTISGLYGENSYQYEEIENKLSANAEKDSILYADLTFYQVYKKDKAFCKIAVNPNTLRIGVKTAETEAYKQVTINQNGFEITDKDL